MGRRRKTDTPLPPYAQTIREARERAGFRSQRALAAALDSTQQTVAGWEAGRGPPRRDMVPRLAAALNVPPSLLIPAEYRGLEESAAAPMNQAEIDKLFGLLADSIARALRQVGPEPSPGALSSYARSVWRLCGGTDAEPADLAQAQQHIASLRELWRDLSRQGKPE